MDIGLYEKTAIVRDVQPNKATYRDQRVELAVRVSQAWVEWQDGWRMAAIQFSPPRRRLMDIVEREPR